MSFLVNTHETPEAHEMPLVIETHVKMLTSTYEVLCARRVDFFFLYRLKVAMKLVT